MEKKSSTESLSTTYSKENNDAKTKHFNVGAASYTIARRTVHSPLLAWLGLIINNK